MPVAVTFDLAERGVAASSQLLSQVTGYLLFWAALTAGALVLASPLVALAVTADIPDDAAPFVDRDGVSALSMFFMLAVAATVPGRVFVFQAALSMYFLIAALGGRAVAVSALPGMSAAAKDGDAGRFGAAWRQALTYSLITSLPALCLVRTAIRPSWGRPRQPCCQRPRSVPGWFSTRCTTVCHSSRSAS